MAPAAHRLGEGAGWRMVTIGRQKASFHPSQLQIINWMAEGLGKRAGEIWLVGRASHTKKRR